MVKKILVTVFTLFLYSSAYATLKIDKIDPPFWYAGMKNAKLQLMVYGQNIGNTSVTVNYPGIHINSIDKMDSNNYLLIYLTLDANTKPGKMELIFTKGKKKEKKEYELKKRSKKGEEHKGFDSSDVLYMLMPDRFANGNSTNDHIEGLTGYKVDREEPSSRHGGDLAGIVEHLDYFTDLGVTALWFTPVLENNMTGGSYHGYATTDYYKVDLRLGSNEEYQSLIEKAHKKGLKIVMDMIFNHCGNEHIWLKDMPANDWFNNSDYKNQFVQTSYKLTPLVDPYSSDFDFKEMNDGWFVTQMPDLNQRNLHVKKYLIQNSLWWIEYSGIDGIRMDTHPYADFDAMSDWLKELNEEYPYYNVVGETWVTEPAYTAYWQKNSKLSPKNSNLKTIMDFSFYDKINTAMTEETDNWWQGLNRIYNNFVYDYLYPDPTSIMAFIENHDTDRFLKNGEDVPALKQALTLLLTTCRIPQLYYGTEILMNGTKEKTDGNVRKDFPGGWEEDTNNAFSKAGRTDKQNDMYDFLQHLLKWRKGNEIISKGTMTHFMPFNGTYVYFRSFNGKTVMVILNGTNNEQSIPTSRYSEIIKNYKSGKDILSGNILNLQNKSIKLSPRQNLIIDLY